jgi:hypothetical protein
MEQHRRNDLEISVLEVSHRRVALERLGQGERTLVADVVPDAGGAFEERKGGRKVNQ